MFTLRRMDNGITSPQSMIDQFNSIIGEAEQQIQRMQLGSDETQNNNENGQKDLSNDIGDMPNAILNRIFKVGALYFSTDSTNPGEILGVGTWELYSQGRTLIGAGGGYTAGDTGGSEVPALLNHTHNVSGTAATTSELTGEVWNIATQSSTVNLSATGICATNTKPEGVGYAVNSHTSNDGFTINANHAHSVSGTAAEHSSGDQIKGNLPPYIVTYIWVRTA